MAIDLRPLTLGELLDRSFSLYRRHFWLFVGLMAVPSAITLLLSVAVQFLPQFVAPPGAAAPDADDPAAVNVAGLMIFFAGAIVASLAYWVAYMVTLGASTVAVSEIYAGRTATIASAYAHVRGRIGRLMLLCLLVGLRLFGLFLALMLGVVASSVAIMIASQLLGAVVMIVGMLLAGFASLLYSLRYAVSIPALVLEDVKAGHAIRRSITLTRGSLGRAAVLIVFTTMIAYAAMALFQGPFGAGALIAGPESRTAFWLNLGGAVTGALGNAVTGPLMIIALALFYYDVRIRKEGLDLDVMIAGLDSHTPPPHSSTLPSAG